MHATRSYFLLILIQGLLWPISTSGSPALTRESSKSLVRREMKSQLPEPKPLPKFTPGMCRLEIDWLWGDYFEEPSFSYAEPKWIRVYDTTLRGDAYDNIGINFWDGAGNQMHSQNWRQFCKGFQGEECEWRLPVESPSLESPDLLLISPQHGENNNDNVYLHLTFGGFNFNTSHKGVQRESNSKREPWCEVERSWRGIEMPEDYYNQKRKVKRTPKKGTGGGGGGGGGKGGGGSERPDSHAQKPKPMNGGTGARSTGGKRDLAGGKWLHFVYKCGLPC